MEDRLWSIVCHVVPADKPGVQDLLSRCHAEFLWCMPFESLLDASLETRLSQLTRRSAMRGLITVSWICAAVLMFPAQKKFYRILSSLQESPARIGKAVKKTKCFSACTA